MVETSAADPYIDPRAVRTRRVVLEAAAAIIATDGAGAITHQRVAERAGVGRATLYRHWPTAADLLYDAMGEVDEPLFRRPTGPLKGWLRRELRRVAVDIGQPNSVQFLAFLVSRSPMEPAAAAQAFKDLLKQDPDFPGARRRLGTALLRLRCWDDAPGSLRAGARAASGAGARAAQPRCPGIAERKR